MRLNPDPRPEAYDLHITVDPRRDRFSGTVEISISGAEGLDAIELHSVDLDLGEIEVTDREGPATVVRTTTHAKRETLTLRLDRALRGARARLRLTWEGPLRSDLRGLYLARSGRRRYAATQLEASDARRFFPCFDEPDKKARFRIRVTTPKANQVVSNGPVERTRTNGKLKTVQFAETPKLSTYLIALIVGDLECSRARKSGTTPIRVWCVPGKKHLAGFALTAAVESLTRLEEYFGLPYPYEKLDLIAVPDFEFGAMENAGAVTFRESLLLVDAKTITLAEKKRVAEVIAHELAHMWYGDLVTMAWWDDLWLNEAFATWMAFLVVDQWKPEWRMWLDFEQHRASAYALDAMKNTHPIYVDVRTPDEATENFDVITYEKGASVVRMLERWLGPPVFRRGVRRYIRKHREANARAADLWEALEQASGQPVEPVVRAWIEQAGFPLLTVDMGERNGRSVLRAHQELFFADPRRPDSARAHKRAIPMVVRVRPQRGRTTLRRALLERTRDEVDLGPAGRVAWAYANADEAGFYRPAHEPELLRKIGAELHLLTPAERMGLLGHEWACVRADRAQLPDFLELIERLTEESEPDVLGAVHGPLGWIDDHLLPEVGELAEGRQRKFIADVFRPAFDELGWKPKSGESETTRQRRATLVSLLGGLARDEAVLQGAREHIGPYLKDRARLDANLAGPVVALAARDGSKSLYDTYLRTVRRARTPQERTRFEMALASFSDPALLERTLALSLSDDIPMQDVVPLLARMLANPKGREATWDFVRARWKGLSRRISPGLAPRLISALPALQTAEHRREVSAFFREHPLPTATRALKQALERFDLDANMRRRTVPALKRWLVGRESG